MKYYFFIFSIIIFFLITACDENSVSWESNPPEIRLVILNEDEILEKSIGDSIYLELGLKVSFMPNIYFIDFEISYDDDSYVIDSINYDIFNFFAFYGEPYPDTNGNNIYL